MRGSLLITFFDGDGKGGSYIDILVNTRLVKRIYNSSNNLYTCPLLIGDVVTIMFTKAPNIFSGDYSIIRKDYTTDDENGDMGIKETSVAIGEYLTEYTFTASTINSAYDFNYILDFSSDTCAPIGNLTYSGGTGLIGQVSTSEILPNGDRYISSTTNKTTINYSGTTGSSDVGRIFKVNNKYQLDNSFNTITSLGQFYRVNDIDLQSDGKLVVVGEQSFAAIPNTGYTVNRLTTTGDLDPSFNRPLFTYGVEGVTDTVIQSDGKIVVSGNFTQVNGSEYNRYVRLNTDGTIDNTYYSGGTGTGFSNSTNCEIDRTNDKIYFFGTGFYNGSLYGGILRLNTDGTLDTTFNGTGRGGFALTGFASPLVNSIRVLSNGKILCVGGFTSYNGVTCSAGVARLNQDGTLDTTFNPGGQGLNLSGNIFVSQPTETLNDFENKYLIVYFTSVTGVSYNGVIIPNNIFFLNEDGTLGNNTDIGTGMIGTPKTCKKLPNGGYLITGAITSYNGTPITNGGMVQITNTGLLQNC